MFYNTKAHTGAKLTKWERFVWKTSMKIERYLVLLLVCLAITFFISLPFLKAWIVWHFLVKYW